MSLSPQYVDQFLTLLVARYEILTCTGFAERKHVHLILCMFSCWICCSMYLTTGKWTLKGSKVLSMLSVSKDLFWTLAAERR